METRDPRIDPQAGEGSAWRFACTDKRTRRAWSGRYRPRFGAVAAVTTPTLRRTDPLPALAGKNEGIYL
jgi:hypothetical protein